MKKYPRQPAMIRKRIAACRATDLMMMGMQRAINANARKKRRKAPMTRPISYP
jgi:hypothetical protein